MKLKWIELAGRGQIKTIIYKSDFETRRGEVVDQYFRRQNNSMSRPPLDLTPLGTNTNNGKTLPMDSIPIRTKSPEPTPLTLPTDSPTLPTNLPEQNGKLHVPGDPDPDPSSLDSSSKKSNSPNDKNYSKSKKKKRDKKKKRRKHKKADS